jgi:hypothetical protein
VTSGADDEPDDVDEEAGSSLVKPALRRRLRPIGLQFQAEMYETALARGPRSVELLIELATVYTSLGRIAEGLELDRELVLRMPNDDTVRYNLACSLALSGLADEALAALERACELGYADADQLRADADLASLRDLPRFRDLVARLESAGRSS